MATMVDAMAGMLIGELNRLSKLDADDLQQITAECMRSKAMNETVKTACALGELHLHSEMFRMGKDQLEFNPGTMFGDTLKVEKIEKPKELRARAEPYKDDFGGRTTVNERGEFECDDGLDGFTATVEDSHKR